MRIEHIQATNYRPWGNVSLDLAQVSGATITGQNGAGKSSLLEAILWCLFGKSRSAGADGVVRLGQTEARVEVVVKVPSGRWRVRRTRSNKGQGKTEVALDRDEGGAWVAAGGAGKRGNDAAIVDALGVDYDTLLATSVAVQGDAGRFTKAQPAERRQVLATMLDLDRWALDVSAARAKARELEADAAAAERRVVLDAAEQVEAARAKLERARAEVATVAAERDRTAGLVREAERAVTLAEAAAAESDRHRAKAAELRAEAGRLRGEADAAQARAGQVATLRARLASAQEAAGRLPSLADRLADAEGEVTARRLSAEARQVSVGSLMRAEAEAEGSEARARDAARRVPNVEALKTEAGKLEALQAAAAQAAAEVDRIVADGAATCGKDLLQAAQERSWTAKAAADAAAATHRAALAEVGRVAGLMREAGASLGRLQAEADAVRPQVQVMGEVPCGASAVWPDLTGKLCDLAGTCKLLGSARTAQARLVELETVAIPKARQAVATAELEHDTAEATASGAQAMAEAATDAADAAAAEVRAIEGKRQALLARHAEAKADAAAALVAVESADRAARGLAEAAELQAQAAQAQAQAQAARAKATALREALPQAVDVAGAEAALVQARTAHGQVQQVAVQVDGLVAQVQVAEGAQGEADRLRARVDALEVEAAAEEAKATAGAGLAEVRRALWEAQVIADAASTAVQHAEAQATAALVALSAAEQVAKASDEAKAEGEAARADAAGWLRCAKACGVAPTLKLEGMALPAIEAEANRVLSVLSHRGMRLELRTQRDLKSADHKRETLDIVVCDDAGQRVYEDFSGGEQFRIDLALRLALARLLAARANAQVELLVIDEGGFGALDPEGIEACKETLRRLDGFGQVLVVTHIETLADALPHRIVVRAGADGSTAEVV